MSLAVKKRLLTVDEYYAMAQAGILTPNDRVELIEGEIIEMSPIGKRHAGCVIRLVELLYKNLMGKALVTIQNPIRLDRHNEPQPDVCVLKFREDRYGDAHPNAQDILLLIEVAESSIGFDRTAKIPMYAQHGIIESWLVDLETNRLELFRSPSLQGYREHQILNPGETAAPLAFQEIEIAINDILGVKS